MKSKSFAFRLIVTMLISIMCFNTSILAENPISVNVDGMAIQFDQPPTIIDGYTLVPFRNILEALGCEVQWDLENRIAIAIKDGTTIQMPIDSTVATLVDSTGNTRTVELAVPAMIIEGSTFVPLRFVSESVEASVEWNGDNRTIEIKTSPDSQPIASEPISTPVPVPVPTPPPVVKAYGLNDKVVLSDTEITVRSVSYSDNYHEFVSNNGETFAIVKLDAFTAKKPTYGVAWVSNDFVSNVIDTNGVIYEMPFSKPDYNQVPSNTNASVEIVFGVVSGSTVAKVVLQWDGEKAEVLVNAITAPQGVKTSGTYVGSVQSDKYHNPTCRFAKQISKENEIWFDTVQEAHDHGYVACKVCNPR